MSKLKTGLVVEGGGMKCVYAAGVLDRFLDDAISFDEVIGVSAGSANAASFLAGQKNRNRRFYEVHS
ncbi:MAG: patatin-like phospholipase family protein, partial [Lachnospiraceae bacterium]|nr:patatin-like phospholipase family protein [Lachnospiraceae bacterium]